MTEQTTPPNGDEIWTRQLIERLVFATLTEQRRGRRWGIFFKLIFLVILLALILPIQWGTIPWGGGAGIGGRHTALVKVEGLISPGADTNAEHFISGLRSAFEDDDTAGVILYINSPGGSPVQAGEMFDEIMRLREAHPKVPVYAVAADICASGGYYVAAAAQEIYANRASIIGSIGVRAGSFGFTEAIGKLGIERRLYTAGTNKSFLDPFEPSQPEDVSHMQDMLNTIHRQFIKAVEQGRGERLTPAREIYSGLVWTGEQSTDLGLIDGLANTRYVAEQLIGASNIVDFTRRPKALERLLTNIESRLSRTLARILGLDGANPWG
jgi:protease-4